MAKKHISASGYAEKFGSGRIHRKAGRTEALEGTHRRPCNRQEVVKATADFIHSFSLHYILERFCGPLSAWALRGVVGLATVEFESIAGCRIAIPSLRPLSSATSPAATPRSQPIIARRVQSMLIGFAELARRKLMNRKLICTILVCIGSAAPFCAQSTQTPSTQTKASAAFDRLRSLAGEWEGTFAWSGARNATGKMDARYYATGNGSSLVENLIQDGVPVMTSVYHMDGDDLRMTHFCAAQNQPRFKASTTDPDAITFSFVDITNLRSPTAGHVHGLEVRFLEPDHLTLKFHFHGGDKDSDELIDLRRRK